MAEERQTNYTIGEGCELPSKGLIYEKPINPHIELRSMTARDEMKRLSPSTTPLKTLADIIEGCCIEKPAIHVYDMAFGDYEYLLHKLRIVTYGDEYKIGLTCPYCGEEFETTAHLEDLEIKEFDKAKFDLLRTVTLPKSGHTVTLKFQTPHIAESIEALTKDYKRRYKTAEVAFDLLAILMSTIETVDGEVLDSVTLENFINKLPAMDMTKIINTLDQLNSCLGIDNNLTVSCKHCGGEIKTFFRIGTEFFRPSNI